MKTLIGQPSMCALITLYSVMTLVTRSVQQSARQFPAVELQIGDNIIISLRNKLGAQHEPSQTTRFRQSRHKVESKQKALLIQVGTLQTFCLQDRAERGKKALREQGGTLQAIAHNIELNKEKEARPTGRHASGDRAQYLAERRKGSPVKRSGHSRQSGHRTELMRRKRDKTGRHKQGIVNRLGGTRGDRDIYHTEYSQILIGLNQRKVEIGTRRPP